MSEITPEEKVIKIKKDLIKNVAIIFLTAMLILTFFSNSIMNRSLPQVATSYINNGTITEAIRGTGTVSADDPYSVTITESRVISGVAVKVGDHVDKDTPMFYLEDSESDELAKAEADLEDLIYKYTAGVLTGELSNSAYQDTVTGNVLSIAGYEARIEAARAKVENAQALVNSLASQIAYADNTTSITDKNAELTRLKSALSMAQTTLSDAKAKYDASFAIVNNNANAANIYDAAVVTLTEKEHALFNSAINVIAGDAAGVERTVNNKPEYSGSASPEQFIWLIFDGNNKTIINEQVLKDWLTYTSVDISAISAAYSAYTDAKSKLDTAKTNLENYNREYSVLATYEAAYNNARNTVKDYEVRIETLSNAISDDTASNSNLKGNLAVQKSEADLALTKAKEEQTQLLLDISRTLDLTNQNSIIAEQREKVEKLREKSVGASVLAPVSGTVLAINKASGEKTSADEALATIQVDGKGMSLTFSVTNEQAKKVHVGDRATLQNSWYYGDIIAVLTKIKNDPDNPSAKKQLVFSIDGNISSGDSLSLSVGARGRDFEQVVPNSAVREDNTGKFILVIEEKSTPFGNRYKAKKVPVEVAASDDKNSAIIAETGDSDYVITTSNKPVSAGTQVRLADSE